MPDESPATATLVAPSSRPEAPASIAAVQSQAQGKLPSRGPNPARTNALNQMRTIGSGMKDGSIKDSSDARRALESQQATQSQQHTAPEPQKQTPPQARQPQAQNQQPPAQDQTPEQKTAAAEKAKQVSQAKRVLVRDGWEASDFEGKSDEEVIRRAEQRRKVHADTDRAFGELSQLKKSLPQPRTQEGQFAPKTPPADPNAKSSEQPGTTAQQQNPAVATDPDIAAIIAEAERTAGAPAAKLFGQLAEVLSNKFGQRAGTGEALARAIMTEQGQQVFAELYPDQAKASPETFDGVRETFAQLLGTGRYSDTELRKAWTDALHIELGAPNETQLAQRRALARQTAAEVGAIDPGNLRTDPATTAPATSKQMLSKAAQLMKANPGKSVDELRRMLHA